jgi:ABC-type transport system involved in multi-copper enzyme maturation permease subunit
MRLTLREAINRKLVLAAVVFSMAFLALYAAGIALVAGERAGVLGATAGSLLASLGLYALHLLAAFLVLTGGIGSGSSDIDSGSLHALLARPLSRRTYLLGRWAGLALLVAVYVTLMGAAIVLIARLWGFTPLSGVRAVALIAVAAILLLTVAVWGSTRLSTLANGMIVLSLFAMAWVAGFIELIGDALDNAAMTNLGIAVSLLMPTDALWRAASYYSQSPFVLFQAGGLGIPLFGQAPPAPALLVWTALYLTACLALALRTFGHRDL